MQFTSRKDLKEQMIYTSLLIAEKKSLIKRYSIEDKPLANILRSKVKLLKNDLEYLNIRLKHMDQLHMCDSKTLDNIAGTILSALSISPKTYDELKFITLAPVDIDVAIQYLLDKELIFKSNERFISRG